MIKNKIIDRKDCDILFVNYNRILEQPTDETQRIKNFLNIETLDTESMVQTIDKRLYRQRH
jgi:hypothetical protein